MKFQDIKPASFFTFEYENNAGVILEDTLAFKLGDESAACTPAWEGEYWDVEAIVISDGMTLSSCDLHHDAECVPVAVMVVDHIII